jgi:hypothetical protein
VQAVRAVRLAKHLERELRAQRLGTCDGEYETPLRYAANAVAKLKPLATRLHDSQERIPRRGDGRRIGKLSRMVAEHRLRHIRRVNPEL